MNKSVYKFCSFNSYSLNNIKSNQLYCSNYETFNDPFECWCIEQTGIPDPEKESDRFFNVIKAWGFPDTDKESALEHYYDYMEEFNHTHSPKVRYFIDSALIACFCSNFDNLLMWSHYADGLRGFCIEFDKKLLIKNNGKMQRFLL
jgi:hypothetical protein